jgi:hypothetical protein
VCSSDLADTARNPPTAMGSGAKAAGLPVFRPPTFLAAPLASPEPTESVAMRRLAWAGVVFAAVGMVRADVPSGSVAVEAISTRPSEPDIRHILQASPLAGFQHYAGRALFPLMRVGDALTLVREPANPFDPGAVRVEWHGVQIGYAPRADNVDLARLMDRGAPVAARILHLQKSRDPWKRVMMEIHVVETPPR